MALAIRRHPALIPSDRVSSLRYPICVIGMGRSGTSLTTALIGLLGIYLGPEKQMLEPIEHDNARGYWEQRAIYEINEEVLGAFGGTWERPPSLTANWERSPALDDVRNRARVALADMYGTSPRRWAWKDPRAAVTLPFWRDLIGEMDFVICVRHPADVANSLAARARHDLDFEGSVALWHRYMRAALDQTDGSRRLILSYEDYFLDPESQIRSLVEFVCGTGFHLPSEIHKRIERFVEPELWHNRDLGNGIDSVRATSQEAADLYTQLSMSKSTSKVSRSAGQGQSLLAKLSIAWIWWTALILSAVIAVTDAFDSNIVLIPLLSAGPICGLLTGRWMRTATVGVWVITLSIFLCFLDEIWGTSAQLGYLGIVIVAALFSTSVARLIEKNRARPGD